MKNEKKKLKVNMKDTYQSLVGVMTSQVTKESKHAQVSVKEGIKRYGEKVVEALIKELSQLDEKRTFTPQLVSTMTKE